MNQSRHTLPARVGKLLSLLPAYPGSLVFVTALNRVLAKHFAADVQTALTGKKLRIRITDAQITFDFEWRNNGFAACRNNAEADLSIAATAHDFLLLARREEDPDTLFFSRRLAMEGDTELGLWVKNTLDSIDLSVFDLTRTGPGQWLSRLKPKLHKS